MGCPDRDDLVGYALGALEPDRERAVGEHAAGCERCALELRRLAPAVGVLAESVEQLDPPPRLRQSLMAAVREEDGRESPRRERVRGFLWRPIAVLGASALVAAGAVGYLIHDQGGGDAGTEYQLSSSLAGASGTVEVEGDAATLKAHGMPPLAMGAVYQVWVAQGERLTPSAAFVPHRDGSATAAVPELGGEPGKVMVTTEARPGMRKPRHLPPLLSAEID
jgi:hypothetical protein